MTAKTRHLAFAALVGLAALAGCATPPAVIPTAEDVRGLRASGTVTMTQVFLSATGVGSGTLTFEGRKYPFTLIGGLNGLGALSGIEGAGEVYNLRDVSQFAGAYIQGAIPASLGAAPTEIWLKNTNGVIIRLRALQNGVTVSSGRYEIYVRLGG
ncbi:MAG TPA: hypothetical protein VEH77_13185 [Roseiarcus sp.]|nr:hypothetical protein [Roseiarcus sp.]